ncbi:MAG: hypothetical protein AB8G99_08730 [Planctomycetaceae bacterium]
MSGKIARSQIPSMPKGSLPGDVRTAVTAMRNAIAAGRMPRPFGNTNLPKEGVGSPLPRLADGCQYFEFQVGAAHPGDKKPTGSRRLVAEVSVKSRQIRNLYFTDGHYRKGTFRRIT